MECQGIRSASATICAAALERNVALLRARLQRGTRLLAVVKADGYGHSAQLVAPSLARSGVDAFGVATVGEGVELRALGLRQPILVLAGAHGTELVAAAEEGLSVALLDREHLREMEQMRLRRPLRVHVKVDTGMGRLGTDPEQLAPLLEDLQRARNVVVEGVFSHFANAEDVGNEFCQMQLSKFRRAVALVKQRWPECCAHLANSVATWSEPNSHFDMVRPGLLLYGVAPSPAIAREEFQPVMCLTAPVLQVREFPPGRPLSYGQTYVTERRTRVAVIGVGYADGYDRRLSNNGFVGLHGKMAPIVGRICMDITLVDASAVPEVRVGDRALLWGQSDGMCLPVEQVAAWAGTISYEMLTRLGQRVPRCFAEHSAPQPVLREA